MRYSIVILFFVLSWCGTVGAECCLVDVQAISPTIVTDIRYATANNFMGCVLYPSARCLLVEPAARALDAIQKQLLPRRLSLKVFDAYRPLSVQQAMWDKFPGSHYIANPAKGSKHNRGAAVDLTIVDLTTGQELEMPSSFDDLSERAHRDYEHMTPVVRANCCLLEIIMVFAGFEPEYNEWWHYNWHDWAQFPLLDVDAESV
jgi:zinc D-Ala-D-Ala dipeptidase